MWKDIPIQWINISISSHLSFCMCVRTVRFYPLSEFQLYKTALLNIVTTFYTRPQNLFILPLTPVPFDHPLLVSPVQELALFSSVSVSLVSRGCSICGSSDFVCTRAQSCLTLWPHGLRPVRLLCPWDSPGKNSGGGCHFLLRGPSRPRGWSRGLPDPGLSPHLLSLQASTVEGLPFPPRGPSWPRGWSGGLPDPRAEPPPPESAGKHSGGAAVSSLGDFPTPGLIRGPSRPGAEPHLLSLLHWQPDSSPLSRPGNPEALKCPSATKLLSQGHSSSCVSLEACMVCMLHAMQNHSQQQWIRLAGRLPEDLQGSIHLIWELIMGLIILNLDQLFWHHTKRDLFTVSRWMLN